MSKPSPNNPLSISNLYCALFGHDYRLSQEITHHIKEYQCTHCKKEATTSVRGRIIAMTEKLKEINTALQAVHAKKLARQLEKQTTSGQKYQVAS